MDSGGKVFRLASKGSPKNIRSFTFYIKSLKIIINWQIKLLLYVNLSMLDAKKIFNSKRSGVSKNELCTNEQMGAAGAAKFHLEKRFIQ
jgi:hypothetical protein